MIIIILILIIFLIIKIIKTYNILMRKNNMVKQSLSTIDIQLEKRFDAVSQQLKIYEKSLKNEERILKEIVSLRKKITNNKTIEEKLEADEALNKFIEYGITVEDYPTVSSIEVLGKKIMTEISLNENEVSAARRQYSMNATKYNTYIQQFPNNILAALFGMNKEFELYKISDESKKEVPIK